MLGKINRSLASLKSVRCFVTGSLVWGNDLVLPLPT